ncbi:SDR family oxidoreductase [Sorangium sp. So ce1153]|uniref:SDR family oxidoreductase n=1 Tax=Sorangium sp. So ce1153 TaxID=3133333 RepID=UPI003F5E7AC0
MIIVTGATGQLGHGIVERLLERVDAGHIGVSVRDPKKAEDLAARGVRVRRGDFDDAASLRDAFEGASQVLIVSSNARASGGDPIAQHRTALAAAREVGARRVLYTSHMGASATSAFPPMHDHAATAPLLEAAGTPFTSLRHGFYAATAVEQVRRALASGELVAPEDGKVSWTAREDLAEADAIVLASEATRFEGSTPDLTGSEALDLADLAAIASDLTGRAIKRVTVSDDAYRASLAARGLPERIQDLTLGLFVASRQGEFARVDPTLEQLLGRPPRRVRELLARALQR